MGLGLHLSSWPRRFLDNMRHSRSRTGVSRTLSRAEIERHLQAILVNQGEDELNRLREEAHRLAPEIGATEQSARLSALIGALLGTREDSLITERARATRPSPLIRVLDRAQSLCAHLDWTQLSAARTQLRSVNAFLGPAEADEAGLILRLPSEL